MKISMPWILAGFYIVLPGNTPWQALQEILPDDRKVNDCAASVLRATFTLS
jgi:hypothetical protein